jgi:hypothetical protein
MTVQIVRITMAVQIIRITWVIQVINDIRNTPVEPKGFVDELLLPKELLL